MPSSILSTEEHIAQYFALGYTVNEIIGMLLFVHNLILSKSTVKRILKRLCLRRRSESALEDIVTAIRHLHRCGYSDMGYRSMWKILTTTLGIRVHQNTVRLALRVMDPIGVELRRRRRLRRRTYRNLGPNYVIHLDGYDKLKPFGISIHGCIDGFSRKILWLKAGPSNKNPRIIASYYMHYIKEMKHVPRLVRMDAGTENCVLRRLQIALRMQHNDSMAGYKSVFVGRSTGNQRIEMLWSFLKRNFTQFWRNFFKDMVEEHVLNTSDKLHLQCVLLCFLPLIQKHLNTFKNYWNTHTIRSQRSNETVAGKPNILFYQPILYDSRNYSFPLPFSEDVLNGLAELYTEEPPEQGCCHEMVQLAEIVTGLSADFYDLLMTPQEAKTIFIRIISCIEELPLRI